MVKIHCCRGEEEWWKFIVVYYFAWARCEYFFAVFTINLVSAVCDFSPSCFVRKSINVMYRVWNFCFDVWYMLGYTKLKCYARLNFHLAKASHKIFITIVTFLQPQRNFMTLKFQQFEEASNLSSVMTKLTNW